MLHHHPGHIEAPQASPARPDRPLAHFLSEQRSGFPSSVRVEETCARERIAAECHVHSERHLAAELDGLRSVVEQRNHRPELAAAVGQPRRPRGAPDRGDAAAHVIALQSLETLGGAIQPIRLDAHVVVGRDDDLSLGETDAGVQRRASSLLPFEDVAQRRREGQCGGLDNVPRTVGRIVVDDNRFPLVGRPQTGEAGQRVAQVRSAVVGRDDNRKLHGSCSVA